MGDLTALDPRPFASARVLGREVELHESIDSTNDRATALARTGAAHGLAVIAGAQTAGRGRLGRTWDSPPGAGVYVSFVVRPALALREAPLLTLAAGVALHRAATAIAPGLVAAIKWPNDLLEARSRRKLAGILVETSGGSALDHAVIGVGVNLLEVPRPPAIASYAGSIEGCTGARVEGARLIAALASTLEEELEALESQGAPQLLTRWAARAAGRGEQVTVGDAHGVLDGVAHDGALLLRTSGGLTAIYAGDLRLAGAPLPGDR